MKRLQHVIGIPDINPTLDSLTPGNVGLMSGKVLTLPALMPSGFRGQCRVSGAYMKRSVRDG